MMGERTVMQESLFYAFSLERHVPPDHLLRSIDRFVDLSGVRAYGTAENLAWLVHERGIEPHIRCSTSRVETTAPSAARHLSTTDDETNIAALVASRCGRAVRS